MKIIIFLLITTSSLLCQEYKLIKDGERDQSMLVGISGREAYQDSNFSDWFNSGYKDYMIDSTELSESRELFQGKLIKVVLGTWCSDSRREVPRFIKILDFLGFPSDKVMFINVDREKKSLLNETENLNIEFVPTFIIYESGKELGRIIESPIETLEKDLITIVTLTDK